MKKTRFIILVLAVALMVMGAGYAYWSETLTVSNTVKTGELDLQFDTLPFWIDEEGDYDNESPYWDDYMQISVTPMDNNHKLECVFQDIYPGAGGYINFKITNTGTVPAVLESLTAANISDPALLKDEFNYVIHSLRLYIPKKVTVWGHEFEWIDIVYADFPMYATTFDDFVDKLESKLSQYTLEPFAYFEINGESSGYDIQLPSSVTNDNFEDKTFSFDLLLNFKQTT